MNLFKNVYNLLTYIRNFLKGPIEPLGSLGLLNPIRYIWNLLIDPFLHLSGLLNLFRVFHRLIKYT